jgi:hypothetical protein
MTIYRVIIYTGDGSMPSMLAFFVSERRMRLLSIRVSLPLHPSGGECESGVFSTGPSVTLCGGECESS